ncbi:hypothetical protein [Salmonella enterica]|uniref:hypothetical protein n=1 Tax=Salmonella enterica TaxID=28901 RepID=UPI0021DB6A3C|nr:hypothetical protein [Salmonella enterica]
MAYIVFSREKMRGRELKLVDFKGLPCSLAALQPCSLAALQPCSLAALQPCSLAALQPCSLAALQPCSLAALQPCSLAALQPCSLAALQPCSLAALQGMQTETIRISKAFFPLDVNFYEEKASVCRYRYSIPARLVNGNQ